MAQGLVKLAGSVAHDPPTGAFLAEASVDRGVLLHQIPANRARAVRAHGVDVDHAIANLVETAANFFRPADVVVDIEVRGEGRRVRRSTAEAQEVPA